MSLVSALDRLHAKHVLPGFADRSQEEREIEHLTTTITKVRPPHPLTPAHLTLRHRTFAPAKPSFSA